MLRVIYADVLIVINIYITYFLLRSAALISKENPDRMRMLLSSFLGGAYSLTVLLPEKFQFLLGAVRIPVVMLLVFIAFGYTSFRSFSRLSVTFLFCSFIFAGLMFALWYFICPAGMYFNGSVLYFDIDILTLVVLTVICYSFLKLFDRLFKSRAPINTVFICRVYFKDNAYEIKSFLDTGNSLRDHFTGNPVIIVHRSIFADIFPDEITIESDLSENKIRFIFCDTVTGNDLLAAFTPEKVELDGAEYSFCTNEVTVALTEKKLFQGEYDAILPVALFENRIERKVGQKYENNKETV